MLSVTAFSILGSLRNALLCPHPGCGVLLKNPVSLPCGHNLCAECATTAIDDQDGCSVCEKPCWGKDARTNHHMARVIEHVTSLVDLSENAQRFQDSIVQLESVVREKSKEGSTTEGVAVISKKRRRQQSPLHVTHTNSSEEGAALLATSLSPAAVQASSNPIASSSQASERKKRKVLSPSSPKAGLMLSLSKLVIESEATEKQIDKEVTPRSPRSIRIPHMESPAATKSVTVPAIVSPTRSVGRNGREASRGGGEDEGLARISVTKESPTKAAASSVVLRKRLATSAVDASQSSEIDPTGSSQPTFPAAKLGKIAVSRSIEVIDESNASWSQRLSSSAIQRPNEQAPIQILDIDPQDSSQSDGPVAKRPKTKVTKGQSQLPVDDGSPLGKTLLSVAKASGLTKAAVSKPLHRSVISSLGHLSAPSSRSGIGSLPLVSGASLLSTKTTQQHKQMPPPSARAIKAPDATTTFSSRFGQGGAERAQRTGKVVLMPSSLSEDDREKLKNLVSLLGKSASMHTGDFEPGVVTHLIVPCVKASSGDIEGKRLCTRTIKYASAVLCGCWVLDIDWVQRCLDKKALVPEEEFEVYSDKLLLDPGVSSPQLGRESARSGKKQMLTGRSVFVKEPLCKLSKAELVIALQCSGANILKSDPLEATASKRPISEAAPLVITSYDLSGGALGSTADNERVAYAVAAKRVGLFVVDQLWFLDSVSRWKIEDESRYTLEGVCVKALRKTR